MLLSFYCLQMVSFDLLLCKIQLCCYIAWLLGFCLIRLTFKRLEASLFSMRVSRDMAAEELCCLTVWLFHLTWEQQPHDMEGCIRDFLLAVQQRSLANLSFSTFTCITERACISHS